MAFSRLFRYQGDFSVAEFALARFDKDPAVRVNAVLMAAGWYKKAKDEDKTKYLKILRLGLTDEDAELRKRTLDVVSRNGIRELEQAVVVLAKKEPEAKERVKAYDTLRRWKSSEAIQVLAAWLERSDERCRNDAVYRLKRDYRNDPKAVELLKGIEER